MSRALPHPFSTFSLGLSLRQHQATANDKKAPRLTFVGLFGRDESNFGGTLLHLPLYLHRFGLRTEAHVQPMSWVSLQAMIAISIPFHASYFRFGHR